MLKLEQVAVTYANGTTALHAASLDFRPGDFTVLLGASGAGKSTLLRVLNGLVPASAGRVQVDGLGAMESTAQWRAHRRRTGMVFQQHHLIGRLSALENVLLGRVGQHASWRTLWPLPRADRLAALAALDRVGLLACANRRADELSGGQQQRVGIARALVRRPRVLLADEPVASLDPASAESALRLMHEICRADGIAAIVSLHQVALARRFADRVIGLAGGQVVFDVSPSNLSEPALEALYARGGPPVAPLPPPHSHPLSAEPRHEPSILSA
jgi:phosphonate transport system ATP-binding protein